MLDCSAAKVLGSDSPLAVDQQEVIWVAGSVGGCNVRLADKYVARRGRMVPLSNRCDAAGVGGMLLYLTRKIK